VTPEGRTPVEIRAGRAADLPALTEIYNHYVLHTPATFDIDPFTVDQREDWFGHYSHAGPHRMLVALRGEVVVGYATSSAFRAKPAYDPSIETTVYLRPGVVGDGLGSALYRRLFDDLRNEKLHRAYAAIAVPNDASVALHRKFGFVEIGTMTEVGRKFGKWWDVLWMERPLP
jgi:phosphinothricin acetyltransferase